MTALRFVGIDPETGQGQCPTVWVDEETSDLVFQGWKADAETEAQALATGPIPDYEAVIRIPARMVSIVRRACDGAERANL